MITYPEEPRCTCVRPWLAVIPPPPCPVHGKFTMWNAVRNGEVSILKIKEYVITSATVTNGAITADSINSGTININHLDEQ